MRFLVLYYNRVYRDQNTEQDDGINSMVTESKVVPQLLIVCVYYFCYILYWVWEYLKMKVNESKWMKMNENKWDSVCLWR